MTWENKSRVATVEEVGAIMGRPASMIMLKQISALDEGCRTVLAQCPLAAVGYRDADGVSRTTFIGGTPGFVGVHSSTRISFTLPDGEAHGPVSFVFLLPGVGETLRINGSVAKRKGAETFVDVKEAYVHCAQAVIRSRLWQPSAPAPTPEVQGEGPLCAPGVADFLAAAPFLALSTWDKDGGSDTSPRGDWPTVARILDGRTLIIADRKGNKRADSLRNLVQDDRLSFAALVPGRTGVLHVRGRGMITDDPELLKTLALRGMPPHAALLIDVEHAEVTASEALTRSRVWTTHVERGTAPDLLAIAGDHLAANMAQTGVLARVLKIVTGIPGIGRMLRLVMNRAYRSGLRKEGYEAVEVVAQTASPVMADPLREVRIAEIRRETPSAVTLVLEDGTGSFDFRPGQFFTLITDIDGRPTRRAYSASSAPGENHLEVTVKHVEGGRFSSHIHHTLRAGDRLSLRGPSGSFHTDLAAEHDRVLIAAGSGITPMMSMIRALLAIPATNRIALLYSNRTEQEIIFADELLRLEKENPGRLTVTHVLTRQQGRLDTAALHNWLTDLRPAQDAHYYLCGPEPLMDTVHNVLTERGVAADHVHDERYTSGADITTTTAPQQMIIQDGQHDIGSVIVEPGQTLLDAGLAAGMPMPYSCTVGNCGDCMVLLRTGEVAMNGPNCLTSRQKADGYVLTCVGCPLSKVTLDIAEPSTAENP
ncbi:FAD-binding oxidoreductase [Actinocrispum sp. NPDC049592]|uniref:FAD-binding oxidoreductase n=1 Tax=Actinocrispum sp. NPDC049592 TaxID=3154835 RepID=UPI003417BB9B